MLLSILLPSKVTVSHSSFDKIFEKDQPNAKVFVKNEFGLSMQINIEITQNNFFKISVKMLYKDIIIDFDSSHIKELSILINEYRKYAATLNEYNKKFLNSQSANLIRNIRSFVKALKDIKSITNLLRYLLKDTRSLNVYTVNELKNSILAKTTIELDADIITIVQPEILQANNRDICLRLHTANIYIANFLFLYPIQQLFSIVKKMKALLRTITPLLWVGLTLYPFIASGRINNIEESFNLLYIVMNTFGIPIILFKTMPRLTVLIIRKVLLRDFKI